MWAAARAARSAAEDIRHAAGSIADAVQRLALMAEPGYGGAVVQLVELLERREADIPTPQAEKTAEVYIPGGGEATVKASIARDRARMAAGKDAVLPVAAWLFNPRDGRRSVSLSPLSDGAHLDEAGEVLPLVLASDAEMLRYLTEHAAELLRNALSELARAEATYRGMHDLKGGQHIETGRAWDEMRRAGDRARELLKGGTS